jgi:hypothetical protein
MRERLTIGFVLFRDALALNLHGPAEVFSRANQILKTRSAPYKLLYLWETGGSIRTSSGVVMQTQAVNSIEVNRLDTSPSFVASAMKNACEEHFYVALAFHQQRTEIDLPTESVIGRRKISRTNRDFAASANCRSSGPHERLRPPFRLHPRQLRNV